MMWIGDRDEWSIEIGHPADEDDRLWLMVHSGSRAVGPAVRDLHLARANRGAGGLWHLQARSDSGAAYLADLDWARTYARENRSAMVLFGSAITVTVSC